MGKTYLHNVKFYQLHPRAIQCIAVDDTKRNAVRIAISRSDNTIEIWNFCGNPYLDRTVPSNKNSSIEALVWCRGELYSAGLHGFVLQYDLKTLSVKSTASVIAGAVWCMAANPNGTVIAAGTEEGYISLFDICNNEIVYDRSLDKQEGRILCISWHKEGSVLATGSVDTIRLWNVDTGHVICRISTGRAERNKETIVWCIALTSNMTVISGDSRGKTCFWSGQHGTLITEIQSHKADVLCLALTDDEKSVFCSGVDPATVQLTQLEMPSEGDVKKEKWVKSFSRLVHSHDVRALVTLRSGIVSGGVDSYICVTTYPPKTLSRYPPLLQHPSIYCASSSPVCLLRYPTVLEVWRLGRPQTDDIRDLPEDSVPLAETPVQILSLSSKDSEFILAAALSPDANYLAYSCDLGLRLFFIDVNTAQPQIKRIKLSSDAKTASQLLFSLDSKYLYSVSVTGELTLVGIEDDAAVIISTISLNEVCDVDLIHLLAVSRCDNYVVLGTRANNIVVIDTKNKEMPKVHCLLPQYHRSPTALAVDNNLNIVVVYSDQKIVEYNICKKKYTKWSREMDSKYVNKWLSKNSIAVNIIHHPDDPDVFYLQDDTAVWKVDKNKQEDDLSPSVKQMRLVTDDSSNSSTSTTSSNRPFVQWRKYKHLVYFGFVEKDLLVVELTPLSLEEKLPPTLKKKRFGVA